MTRAKAIKLLTRMKSRVVTDDLDTTIRVGEENEAIDLAIHDLKAVDLCSIGVPVWNSVADRLPEESGQYLCCIENAAEMCMYAVHRWSAESQRWRGSQVGSYIEGVSHWAQIPSPVEKGPVHGM